MKYLTFILLFSINLLVAAAIIQVFDIFDPKFPPMTNARLDCAKSSGGDELSFFRHYHDLDGVSALVKNADIIIYGNSRVLFGLPDKYFADHIKQRFDLNVVFLAHGNKEKGAYLYKYLQKFPVKDKLFLLNVDDNFFDPEHFSGTAKLALSCSRITAKKRILSAHLRWQLSKVSKVIYSETKKEAVILRDKTTESWVPYQGIPTDTFPIHYKDVFVKPSKNIIDFSKTLMNAIKSTNNTPIFIGVPTHDHSHLNIKFFSKLHNTPYYLKKIAGLSTFDKSHLDSRSSEIYSKLLLKFLVPRLLKMSKEKRSLPGNPIKGG